MQAARMRRAISKCWKRGLRARPLRRKSCSIDITMRGAARSIRSSSKKRIELGSQKNYSTPAAQPIKLRDDGNRGECRVLEHYHNINSVCAQKVRIALHEKRLEVKEHLLMLRGDQHDPAYRKLNPNGVVPTLVHDGKPIIESSLILYYLDDAFPERPLMRPESRLRYRVRMYNKLVDEYVHNSCMILTFATAFRPNFIKMPRQAWLAEINKTPLKRRAEYKRSVIEHGLDSEFVTDAIAQHEKLLSWMTESLQGGRYLAGDDFSNADCAVIPYILRLELLKLAGMWDRYPAIADWWARMRERPSVKTAVIDRMTDRDWAPFRNLAPDPWPKVQSLMKAA